MLKIFSRSFKVVKGSLWGHFRFDKICSNWAEIWCEWSFQQSKHLKKYFTGHQRSLRGRYKVTKVKKVKFQTTSNDKSSNVNMFTLDKQLKLSLVLWLIWPQGQSLWVKGQIFNKVLWTWNLTWMILKVS